MTTATEAALKIDMDPFCCVGELGRFDMSHPFFKGGWRYATDGRIAIRVPAHGAPDSQSGDGAPFPPCDELFTKRPPTPCDQLWPHDGMVRVVAECPQCDGDGHVYDEDGDKVRCLVCLGLNPFEQDNHQIVGVHNIAAKYDRLIRSLPNVRYQPFTGDAAKWWTDPLYFVFDGGEGAVMGLRSVTGV